MAITHELLGIASLSAVALAYYTGVIPDTLTTWSVEALQARGVVVPNAAVAVPSVYLVHKALDFSGLYLLRWTALAALSPYVLKTSARLAKNPSWVRFKSRLPAFPDLPFIAKKQ